MEPASLPPNSPSSGRSQALAAKMVKRVFAGGALPTLSCRACNGAKACRSYEFKARRSLRFGHPESLSANTTWIMARHEEMIPGTGGICAPCAAAFFAPELARAAKRFFWLGLVCCLPLPAWFLIQRRTLHQMTSSAYMVLCFFAVLFLLGLAALASAWFVDLVVSYKFNRIVLNKIASLERAALRDRFPTESYALQIGIRFTEPPSEEIVSCDDGAGLSIGDSPGATSKS